MTTSIWNATALAVEAIVENLVAKRGGWRTCAIAVRLVVARRL